MPNVNFLLKWTGCLLAIAGAFCVANRIQPIDICLFNIGSLAFLIWGWRIREYSIVFLNTVMLGLYIYGAFQ